MKQINDTVVIIPAYNEGSVIAETLKDAFKYFSTIIVVNDGSSDDTPKAAKGEGAIVITHASSLGAGGATQTGIEYAVTMPQVKYFATMDADGQHLAEDLVKMRQQLISKKDDIVIGSRFLGKVIDISPLKKMLLKAATYFSNKTSGTQFTDTHNGIRIFNRRVAETIDIKESGYQHASEILEKIKKNDYAYSEAPVTVIYTEYSKSKGQSMINAINIATDVIVGKVINK